MKTRNFLTILLASLIWLTPAQASPALTRGIYDDVLGAGWQDWSWTAVNLSASSPVHGGSHSIGVTFDAWERLIPA